MQAELIGEYDALGLIVEDADDNRANATGQIVDSLSEAFEGALDDPGDDLAELKKQSALIAVQHYIAGARQMREKIGAQLTEDGIVIDDPSSDVIGSSDQPTAVDDPDASVDAIDQIAAE